MSCELIYQDIVKDDLHVRRNLVYIYVRSGQRLVAQFVDIPGFEKRKTRDFNEKVSQIITAAQKLLDRDMKKLLDFESSHRKKSTLADAPKSVGKWLTDKVKWIGKQLKNTTFNEECAKLLLSVGDPEKMISAQREELKNLFLAHGILWRSQIPDPSFFETLESTKSSIEAVWRRYEPLLRHNNFCFKRLKEEMQKAHDAIAYGPQYYYEAVQTLMDVMHQVAYGCVGGR